MPRPGGPNSSTWSSASPRCRAAPMKISSCSRTFAWPTYSARPLGPQRALDRLFVRVSRRRRRPGDRQGRHAAARRLRNHRSGCSSRIMVRWSFNRCLSTPYDRLKPRTNHLDFHEPTMNLKSCKFLAAAAMLAFGAAAFAHGYRAGDVQIDHPYATPSPAGASNGAAYLTRLENTGKPARPAAARAARRSRHAPSCTAWRSTAAV